MNGQMISIPIEVFKAVWELVAKQPVGEFYNLATELLKADQRYKTEQESEQVTPPPVRG